MSFWAFCCKFPQVYRPFFAARQYPDTVVQNGGDGTPELDGCPGPSIDNEGDWIKLSDYAGIKSDGTLWCWIQEIVLANGFKNGDYGVRDKPVQLGTDTDWSFVASNSERGFAIKQDGSLWAFGLNVKGCLGIGIGDPSLVPNLSNAYRCRLSTGIKRIASINPSYCHSKPEATVAGGPEGSLGTGATFNVEWYGSANYVYQTSGGSGYTSAPSVRMVGSVPEDEGKSLSASGVSLSNAPVVGFTVVNGGNDYTFATASLRYNGASATAVIENGKITGWTLVSGGSVVAFTAEPLLRTLVVVSGDGDGAVAEPVYGGRQVTGVSFPPAPDDSPFYAVGPPMWTSTPSIEITGGGGSGAAFTVTELVGKVKSISVVTPGSGYTQSRTARLYVSLSGDGGYAYVDLVPAAVAGIVATAAPQTNRNAFNPAELKPLNKSTNGKMMPFTLSISAFSIIGFPTNSDYVVESTSVLKNDESSTPIGTSDVSSTVIDGCKHPPFVRRYWRYTSKTTNALAYFWKRNLKLDLCDKVGYYRSAYFSPSVSADWPVSGDGISISGTGSVETENVDGNLVVTKKSWGYGGVETYPTHLPPTLVQIPDPEPYSYSRYTGRIRTSTLNVVDLIRTGSLTANYPSEFSTSFHQLYPWYTPTLEKKTRIYFEPSTVDGKAVYAEAAPVGGNSLYGFGTSPAIISGEDALYEYEPDSLALTDWFELPTRVGSEAWKSVSLSGYSSYGVATDGKLYWWGDSTANGLNYPCVTPTPVGQGCTIDVSVDGEMQRDYLGDAGVFPIPASAGRVSPSVPQHGVFNLKDISFTYLTEERGAPFRYKSTTSYSSTFFPPDSDLLSRVYNIFGGAGYTSTPSIEHLHPGKAVASFSGRLIGPTSFTDVYEDCARGEDGVWYCLGYFDAGGNNRPQAFAVYPQNNYEYSITANMDYQDSYNSKTSATRTVGGVLAKNIVSIANGGSGYSSATLNFTQSISLFDNSPNRGASSQSTSVDSTYSCEESDAYSQTVTVTYPLKATVVTLYNSNPPATTSGSIGLTTKNGAVAPTTFSFTRLVGGVAISPTITGAGSDATVVVKECSQKIESHLPPVTPPAIDQFSRSYGVGVSSDSLFSVPYANYKITYPSVGEPIRWPAGSVSSAYTMPSLSGVSKNSGRTLLKSDSSAWRVGSGGVQTDLNAVTMYRVFPASLAIQSTGEGYEDVISATVTQQSGVATGAAAYSATVMAVGVVRQGSGYSAPPAITLTAPDGVGAAGTATAVIAGPVAKVTVTTAGSGYRVPPKVVFSGKGIHGEASCSLTPAGGVSSVSITDGGRYRNSPPTITLEPVVQVESLTLTAGGSGYRSAPDVHIGSGGGVGATATARITAHVSGITIIAGGDQYTSPPEVIISGGGGSGAAAVAVLSEDGKVAAVNVTNGGDGYRTPPAVSFSGGGGFGASATAVIDGSVDQVTLVNRGEDFVQPPTVVFYNGGGGIGAAATAAIGSVGSGAAATAVINGSIIFCTHSGSNGLQAEPAATVSQSTNYLISELNEKLSSGTISQKEYDDGVFRVSGRVKARITGVVTGVNVQSGGSNYDSSLTSTSTMPVYAAGKLPAFAEIRDEMAEYASTGQRASGTFGSGQTKLTGAVSGGSITSFTAPSSLSQLRFWRKPEVVAIDGVSAIPKTCITLAGTAVRSASVNSGEISSASASYYNGIVAAEIPDEPFQYGLKADVISLTGGFSASSFGYGSWAFYRTYFAATYSPLPTMTIQDEAGAGATINAANSPTAVSGGDGYTLGARLTIVGGTPRAWSQKAVLKAVVSNGSVTSITIESGGEGYRSLPDIFIIGGGGRWARAGVAEINQTNGAITGVMIANNGRGYTSEPTVVVVDNERPFHMASGPISSGLIKKGGVVGAGVPTVLNNYKAEFGFLSPNVRRQMTIDSPVGILGDRYGARFVPFFEDDGYVEGVEWSKRPCSGGGYFCGVRPMSSSPTVSPTGTCDQPSQFSTKIVNWSSVVSENALKTVAE